MDFKKIIPLIAGACFSSAYALDTVQAASNKIELHQLPGFFRFSFDNVKMPNNISDMGLVGVNYFTDITPTIYGGAGAYGAITGSQGGFFTLGLAAGLHHQIVSHLWADAGLFVGGGGGRSSLVGGGLMVRPHVGLDYDFQWVKLGLHYSYITFPDGRIHSSQVGLDLDIPYDFNYVRFQDVGNALFTFKDIQLPKGKFLTYQRNDFALLVQAYIQKQGTLNVNGEVQDGTIGLVGAELDHYLTQNVFWSLKSAGAFTGMPNGYMDVLGGVGYRYPLGPYGFAIIPQLFLGAGGGGNSNTGGGVLVQPQIGLDIPLSSSFAARINGGYLWSPKGQIRAATVTGMLIYHLDIASATNQLTKTTQAIYQPRGWRVQLLNQTYVRPQRANGNTTDSSAELVAVQIDQLFSPYFFFSYQAASAYSGNHTGGLATGMIGPGLQTPQFFHQRMHLFAEFLIGAAGGGGLGVGGGAIISPLLGAHLALTPAVGLQVSAGTLQSVKYNLNTPIVNAGLTFSFGMLEKC